MAKKSTVKKAEAAATTKAVKAAPKKAAKVVEEDAGDIMMIKTPKAWSKVKLVDLYDTMMEYIRNNMEIGQAVSFDVDEIGTITGAKVVNKLGVSEFSTVWTLDDIALSKAVLQYILIWNGKNNEEDTNKRVPMMKPPVDRWLKANPDYIVDGMYPEAEDVEDEEPTPSKKTTTAKRKKAKATKDDDDDESAETEGEPEVEEEKPAPKGKAKGQAKGKAKAKPEPEPEEEAGEDGLTDEDKECTVKKKALKKALEDLLDEDEMDEVLDAIYADAKIATIGEILEAIDEQGFDTSDDDLIAALKGLAD